MQRSSLTVIVTKQESSRASPTTNPRMLNNVVFKKPLFPVKRAIKNFFFEAPKQFGSHTTAKYIYQLHRD